MLALEKDPVRRPTAAAMGHALDEWCLAQNEFGSPERLQVHLQELFPRAFQPISQTPDHVSLTGMEGMLKASRRRSLLARLFGR
jgi:hypothetical protein